MARKLTPPPPRKRPRKLRVQTPGDNGQIEVRTITEDDDLEREDPPNKDRDDFLDVARRRWETIAQAESKVRTEMVSDQKFRAGDQWDEASRSERETDMQPCLTNNRLPAFVRQITNEAIQQRPGIQVDPHDGKADQDIAEIFQGIIRRIEDQSDAESVYEIAGDHQVTSGRGYIEAYTEYADQTGFEQEIFLRAINNPLAVYLDVSAQKPDKSDARWGFIIEHRDKTVFEEEYGEETYANLEQWAQLNDRNGQWLPDGRVTLARYYYVEVTYEKLALLRMPKPMAGGTKQITAIVDSEAYKKALKAGAEEVMVRRIESRAAYYALITGAEILDGDKEKKKGRRIPGRRVPIIPVIGEELNIAGEVDYRGIVRDAKDPQRMDNYYCSAEAAAIGMITKAPWIMAEGQDEGYEWMWEAANRRAFSRLKYKPKVLDGNQLAPPPQRVAFEPAIAGLSQARKQAQDDMMGIIGLHQPSLGQQGPEQSGRAIRLRQMKGEQGTSQYMAHLSRAIKSLGRLLVEWIPVVYDTPRVLTILGLDDQPKQVAVHGGKPMTQMQPGQDSPTDMSDEDMALALEVPKIYNLAKGQYNLSLSVGPRMAARRQEGAMAMTDLIQTYPNAFPMIGDLMVENMDFPGARTAAARLKNLVPPQAMGQQPSPADAQAQAQIQQLTTELQQLQDTLRTKKLELASKEYQTAMMAEAQIVAALVKAKSDQGGQMAQAESDRVLALIDANKQRISDELGVREAAIGAHADVTSAAMDATAQKAQADASVAAAQAQPPAGQPSNA